MTQVFFNHNGPECELQFVKWTDKSLIVKFPEGSVSCGENWRMALTTVEYYLRVGCIRIVGDMPARIAAQQKRVQPTAFGQMPKLTP